MSKEELKEALKTVKIGSKIEAKWAEVLNRTEESIIADNINLRISNMIVAIAKQEINKEKEKYK